jgi:hypothetical protein
MDRHQLTAPEFYTEPEGTLFHSHAMEHWRNPRAVQARISKSLQPGARVIFSIPDIDHLLSNGLLAPLNFEHTFHLSRSVVDRIMSESGFSLLTMERHRDHSLFFAYERIACPTQDFNPSHEKSADLVTRAHDAQRRDAANIEQAIRNFDGSVFLFGAHIFSQYLLKLGVPEACITGVLDNSPSKHGKRLYGTNLPVTKPSELKESQPIMVVVRTGAYDNEIIRDLRQVFGDNVVFCEKPLGDWAGHRPHPIHN